MELLKAHTSAAVKMTAYSFDQPEVVSALAEHGGQLQLLADAGMTREGRTKQQLQSLLELRSRGHSVKLGRGTSLQKAYQGDNRTVTVGSGLKGIQHAKSCIVLAEGRAHLLLGSCNWTTSSRANRESGVKLSGPSSHQVFQDIIQHFEIGWSEGFSLEQHLEGSQQEKPRKRLTGKQRDPEG